MEQILNNGLILPQSGYEITSKEEMSYEDGGFYFDAVTCSKLGQTFSLCVFFCSYTLFDKIKSMGIKKIASYVKGIYGAICSRFSGHAAFLGPIVCGIVTLALVAISAYAISFISNVLTAQTLGTGVEMSWGFLHFKANYK